eukprot:s549_g2.t1
MRERTVAELIHLQLLAVNGVHMSFEEYGATENDATVLYQWLGPARYVGIAGLRRHSRPATPGPAQNNVFRRSPAAQVQKKVDSIPGQRNLPSTSGITVKRREFVTAFRKAINQSVASNPPWSADVKCYVSHVRQATRLVPGKSAIFADLQNCSARAQSFDWARLGSGLQRVEANWCVPQRLDGRFKLRPKLGCKR